MLAGAMYVFNYLYEAKIQNHSSGSAGQNFGILNACIVIYLHRASSHGIVKAVMYNVTVTKAHYRGTALGAYNTVLKLKI